MDLFTLTAWCIFIMLQIMKLHIKERMMALSLMPPLISRKPKDKKPVVH